MKYIGHLLNTSQGILALTFRIFAKRLRNEELVVIGKQAAVKYGTYQIT